MGKRCRGWMDLGTHIWHPPHIFFCRGRRHRKEERAWDRDHRTHSLIFDYYWLNNNSVPMAVLGSQGIVVKRTAAIFLRTVDCRQRPLYKQRNVWHCRCLICSHISSVAYYINFVVQTGQLPILFINIYNQICWAPNFKFYCQ